MLVNDQLGRLLFLSTPPKRIVSLVPSLTELLCDMGLKERLVGVTKFCVHPKGLRQHLQIVGGTKQVRYETLKALKPDIIICNKEENTLDIVNHCNAIAPVYVSDIHTIEDCVDLIKTYGSLFNVEAKANQLVEALSQAQERFNEFLSAKQQNLKVAYFIWKDPWMVAASNTFINHLLVKNKFINVFSNSERYPSITLDDSRLKTADVILLSSEPYPFKASHKSILEEKFPQAKILIVDGEMFSWYGSRLIEAFSYFKQLHNSDLLT